MKSLIEFLACSLVEDREAVRVRESRGARETHIELKVSPQETGKVIGKQGRTARAMRTLLDVGARKVGKRFTLEILE